MSDVCEGFYFRYFVPDAKGLPKEVKQNAHFIEAENKLLLRIREILRGRPDLMEAISCIDNGLEVRLYHGTNFRDYENEIYFYGRVTQADDQMVMELATEEILYGGQENHDNVLDVVVHELAHLLDFLDDLDGIFEEWSASEVERFRSARREEQRKIRAKHSVIDWYALTNDMEFLAVLVETFFVKPKDLKKSAPILYDMMKDYFKQDLAG